VRLLSLTSFRKESIFDYFEQNQASCEPLFDLYTKDFLFWPPITEMHTPKGFDGRLPQPEQALSLHFSARLFPLHNTRRNQNIEEKKSSDKV